MSPTRPEREQDCSQPEAADDPCVAPRMTPVSGAVHVEARLELQLSQCRRRRGLLALLCVSVDAVAPSGGELDAELERRVRHEVSLRIGNAVRATDRIVRESDRDTCIMMPGADAGVADRVGRRLARLVNGDYVVDGELLQVAVRVGAACHPGDGSRAPELLRKACDRA